MGEMQPKAVTREFKRAITDQKSKQAFENKLKELAGPQVRVTFNPVSRTTTRVRVVNASVEDVGKAIEWYKQNYQQ